MKTPKSKIERLKDFDKKAGLIPTKTKTFIIRPIIKKQPNTFKKTNPHLRHYEWKLLTKGKNRGKLLCSCGQIVNDWKPSDDLKASQKAFLILAGSICALLFLLLLGYFNRPKVLIPKRNTVPKTRSVEIAPTLTPIPTQVPLKNRTNDGTGRWIGKVSHYSTTGCLGCSATLTMANGQTLDDNAFTIAFNWLPLSSQVRVTNLDNGKSVIATVTDTGGFNTLNRIADLVPAVANVLETKTDVSQVLIEQL